MEIQSGPDIEKTEDEDALQPGEAEVELSEDGPEDDESEAKPEAPPQEERKTRRERREEHESRRIADQVKAQVEAAQARIRQEIQQEYEQRYRPAENTAPKVEAVDDTKEIRELRKRGERTLRLMKDPETSDEELRELKEEYQGIQEKIIGEIAKRAAPKVEAGPDPLATILRTEFTEFYENPKLMEAARQRGQQIAAGRPNMDPYAVARQSFLDVRAAIERMRSTKTTPEQASKYGSPTSSAGPRDTSGGASVVRLTSSQRKMALSTYSDKVQWSDDKKIETWAKNQKKLGLL